VTKINRFHWVRSPKGGKIHIKDSYGSEGPARCGTYVKPRWHILNMGMISDPVICKRCQP